MKVLAIALIILITPSLFAAQKTLTCVSGTSELTLKLSAVGEEVDYLIPTPKSTEIISLGKDIKVVTINKKIVFSSVTGVDMGEAGELVVNIMAGSSKNEFLTLLLREGRLLLLTKSGVSTYDSITCEIDTKGSL